MLEKLGYAVDVVADGRAAIAKAEGSHYDFIFMDGQMPEMDGYEAVVEIRKREQASGSSHQVIIALTANAFPEDRQRCRTAGMDDFLTKPVTLNAFRETLGRWGEL